MRQVVIEYERLPHERRSTLTRGADLGRIIDAGGNLTCPRCGNGTFTAAVNQAGWVILSCYRCPTHIAV